MGVKSKEYYMEQYHVLWDECLKDAGEECVDDVTALATEYFEERCKTDEVVGYYIVLHGDEYALFDWKRNIEGKEFSEQDKEVDSILEALYGNDKCYVCSSCGKRCYDYKFPEVVFKDLYRKTFVCEECSIDYEQKSDGRIVLCGEDTNDFEQEVKIEEDKFLVIKKEDIQKYLSNSDKVILNLLIGKVSEGRAKDGKNTSNKYWVVNRDEKYADKVLQIILDGERM